VLAWGGYDPFMVQGFVGRGEELALLGELVAGVSAGAGGVVLVEGEQGIGKTSVLRAGLAGAEAAGCRVLWGAGDELRQRFPLQLMLDCLGSVPESEQAGWPAAGSGAVMAGDPVLAGVERLLAVVDRLCARSPVVLVAEDLQWADEASVLVWSRLGRAAGQMPLLLAGSLRPGAVREDLKRLPRVVTSGGGSVLDLRPLPDGEVAELVGHLVGGSPGRQLTEFVGQAGGNPLYARELADGLVREGQVRLTAGSAELTDRVADLPVAGSLTALIGERLDGLADNVVNALRWAAVLGPEFSVADLELVSGRPAGDLIDVIDVSLGAGVVAEAGPVFRFRHDLVRQVLYERMPARLRSALHARTARALADAGARPGRVAAQLAAQLTAVQRPPGTEVEPWVVDWLAAAAPALTYLAPAVAADLIRDVMAELPDADPRREGLEASLVTVAFLLVQNDEVERVGRRLLTQAQDPDRAAEMTWMVGYTLMRTSRAAEASAIVKAGLGRTRISEVWTARLTALDALLYLVQSLPDVDASVLDDALAVAERSGDALAIGYALHVLTVFSLTQRDNQGTLERSGRGLAVLGDDPQASELRLSLLANRAAALSALDRSADTIETAREALVLAEKAGTPRLASARFVLAFQHYIVGEWDDALAEIAPAVGLPGPDWRVISIGGLIAVIAVHRADWQTADAHLSRLPSRSGLSGAALANSANLMLARALLAERDGRYGEAAEVLAIALDPDVAAGMTSRGFLMLHLARAAIELADEVTVAAAAKAAQEEADQEQSALTIALADQCRGLLTGDPGPVLAAADYFGASGRVIDRGLALEDAAVLAARRGDLAAARRALAASVSAYETLSASLDIERAGERLRPFGVRRRRPRYAERPVSGWGALTPTEAKVAGLVAAARSNPDIAAELFMSRYTVQTHVSHILAKLGAQSRVEIAAEAVRHASAADLATA
jgi:DNA-binding CsgD family transcriptional regulator